MWAVRVLVVVVAAAAFASGGAGSLWAGDCPASGDYTLRLARSEAAVIGEAIPSGPGSVSIDVEQVLKGSSDPERLNAQFDTVAGSIPEGRRGFLLDGDGEDLYTLTACAVVDADELAAAAVSGSTPGESAYLVAAGWPFGMAVLDVSGNALGYYLGDEEITTAAMCPGGQRVALGTRSDKDPGVWILDLATWETVSHVPVPGSAGEVSELVCRSSDGADFDAIVRQPEIAAWIASSRDSHLTIQAVPESRGGGQIQGDMAYIGTGEEANVITAYSLPSFEVISSQNVPLDAVAVGAWAINPAGTTAAAPTSDGLVIADMATLDIIATLDIGLTDDLSLSRPILQWVGDDTLAVVKPAVLAIGPQERGMFAMVGADGTLLDSQEIAGLANLAVVGEQPVLLTSSRILVGRDGSSIPVPQDTELPRAIVALEQPVEVAPFPAATIGTVLDLTPFASTIPTAPSTTETTETTSAPTTGTNESTSGFATAAIALLAITMIALGGFTLSHRRANP